MTKAYAVKRRIQGSGKELEFRVVEDKESAIIIIDIQDVLSIVTNAIDRRMSQMKHRVYVESGKIFIEVRKK